MAWKIKNRVAFGYGLLVGNLVYNAIISLLVRYWKGFGASYDAQTGLIISIFIILIALYFIMVDKTIAEAEEKKDDSI